MIAKELYEKLKRLPKVLKGQDKYFSAQTKCAIETFGNEGAAWTFCPSAVLNNSIIYSFGVGRDVSFDLKMIETYQVNIHAFDPTQKAIEWVKQQQLPEKFHFHNFGLADYDGTATFYPPENPEHVSATMLDRPVTKQQAYEGEVKRLKTIVTKLEHPGIDVLKMDIEGMEYKVIDDIVKCEIPINQLLIEFHHRFEQVGLEKTIKAIDKLNEAGFSIFHVSETGQEFSFIKD